MLSRLHKRSDIRAFFKKKVRAEPEQGNELTEDNLDPVLRSFLADTNITRGKAVQIPTVSGTIDEIARTISNIPIRLYKKVNGKVVELEGDRRVFLLNEETGDTLDASQMKQAIVRDYYLSQGGFIYVDWNGLEVESLRYVESGEVSIAQNSDVIFKDYVILVQGKSYYPSQFIRVLRNTTDGMRGNSIVKENDKLLSVLYNSLIFEEVLVKTGGNKKGFVKSTKR